MKRTRIPGLIDIVRVDDPAEIRELAKCPEMDRQYKTHRPLFNGLLLRQAVHVLAIRGQRFTAMRPREQAHRASEQDALWTRLNEAAATTRLGPESVEGLAQWVKGNGTDHELGLLVQEAVGRLFVPSYQADDKSWSAALLIRDAPRTLNPVKLLWWTISGQVRRAKTLLHQKVDGNMMGVHGTAITVHNIVKGFHKMRTLYAAIDRNAETPAKVVASQCLFAPPAVMRQPTAKGEINGCPFTKGTLFILGLSKASKQADSDDMVFLENTWGRCPADTWVPALFEGVWKRVLAALKASY